LIITSVRARTLGNSGHTPVSFEPPPTAPLGAPGPFGSSVPVPAEPVALTVVEIETDTGLTGIGTVGGRNIGATAIIEGHLSQLLIGEDATRIEWLWNRMYKSTHQYGMRGAVIMAMSGVDIALWDLAGKRANLPVYDLIGGKTKDTIPLYLSTLNSAAGLDALLAAATAAVDDGFRALKYFFARGPNHGPAGMREELEIVRELRNAIGPDIQLMLDPHFKWDLPYAMRMFDRLVEFDIAWIEEPIPIDDLDGHERLTNMNAIALAAGEHSRTRFDYVALINAGVYYLQPDMNRVGGFSELLKICGLAASHSRAVCPHQGWLHSYHLIAATSCCPIGEFFPRRDPIPGNSLLWEVLDGEPQPVNGSIDVPDGPGFGWTINEAGMARYAI
jgi:L-alanine-DL-glutamate epimerase-like enolase superfamily enzyme